ncbi:hypothetical protein CL638_01910 [bacterium]|nr:hypothetical protein [bacterium]
MLHYDIDRLPEIEGAEIVSHDKQDTPLNLSQIRFRAYEGGQTNPLLADIEEAFRVSGVSLNANHLEAMIENKKLLPKEWRNKIHGERPCIFFWGTIYRDVRSGKRFVRYLTTYNGASWLAGKHFLCDRWFPFCLSAQWQLQ